MGRRGIACGAGAAGRAGAGLGADAGAAGAGLCVEGLAFSYPHGGRVFSDVGLELAPGQVCSILGPNGAGKTTLLNCIGGYLRPERGRVLVGGRDVAGMPARERARRLGLVAQLSGETIDLEVLDYLVLGHAARIGLTGAPCERDYARAEEVMEGFGIGHLRGKTMEGLSGGERQQVEIARVLVQDTGVVLMDEPTNHLDFGNQHKVLRAVRRLAEEEGKAVLLTTHMPDHALLLGGQAAVMDGRGELAVGPVGEVVTQETLAAVYQTDVCLAYVGEAGRVACVAGRL